MDPSDDGQKKSAKQRQEGMQGFRGMFDRPRSKSLDVKQTTGSSSQPAKEARQENHRARRGVEEAAAHKSNPAACSPSSTSSPPSSPPSPSSAASEDLYFKIGQTMTEASEMFEKSQYREAERLSIELFQLGQQADESFCQIKALMTAGYAQRELGKYQESLDSFMRMLDVAVPPDQVNNVQAWALSGIGAAYTCLNENKKAIKYLLKYLQIEKQEEDKSTHELVYGCLGTAYSTLGNDEAAIPYFKKHLDIALELGDEGGQGSGYNNIGAAYARLGNLKKSMDYHQQDLNLSVRLGDMHGQERAYNNIGHVCERLGNLEEALEYHRSHLKIAQSLSNRHGQGIAYANIGSVYTRMGEFKQAIVFYQKHINIAQELNDTVSQGKTYSLLGNAYSGLGDHKQAIAYHQKHLDLAVQCNDKARQGIAYNNLGTTFYGLGEYKKAAELHEKQLKIALLLDDKPGQGLAYTGLGRSLQMTGQVMQAHKYHIKHLKIAQELRNVPEQGKAYRSIGDIYVSLRQYQNAVDYYQKQLDIAQKLDDKYEQGQANGSLGTAYHGLREYARAIKHLQSCLDIAQKFKDESLKMTAQCSLGAIYYALKQYQNSIDYVQASLDIAVELHDKPSQAKAYGNLGSAHSALGDYAKGLEYHQKQLDIAKGIDDLPGLGKAYQRIAYAYYSLENYEQAIFYYQKDLEVKHQLGDLPGQSISYGALGRSHLRLNQLDCACSSFASADAVLCKIEDSLGDKQWREQALHSESNLAAFMDEWVLTTARLGDMERALRLEEQRRCRFEATYQGVLQTKGKKQSDENLSMDTIRTMATSLGAGLVIVFKAVDNALLTWVLSGETGELVYERCLDQAYQGDDVLQWVNRATFVEWAKWQKAFEMAKSELGRLYKKGQVIDEHTLAQLVQSTISDDLRGDLDEELWTSIRNPSTFPETLCEATLAYGNLRKHCFKSAEDALRYLSDLLWEPISKECQLLDAILYGNSTSTKPIYILPDPELSPLPFGAFKVGDRFLAEVVVVAQALSLRTAGFAQKRWQAICNEKQPPPPEALVVSHDWGNMPEFLQECCEELRGILPAEVIAGDDASKEIVIEQMTGGSASLIHFLVEGLPGDGEEDSAGLCLAGAEVLRAREIYECFTKRSSRSKARRTRLMVLPACSSGTRPKGGSHIARQGVQGFGRAALMGGIPCMLASKWNVPVKESTLLMARVYAYMALNKDRYRTVAEALQAAVASLLAHEDMKYKDSFYYWAGFISHGFADVLLDDRLLDEIHARLSTFQKEANDDQGGEATLEVAMKALTRDAYHRAEELEQTLMRECCEKWRSASGRKAAE